MSEEAIEKIPNFAGQYDVMHRSMLASEVIATFVRHYGKELTAEAIDQAGLCPAVPGKQLIEIYLRNRNTEGEII